MSDIEVREAKDGVRMCEGLALIAPGDQHMEIRWRGDAYEVTLHQGEPVHHQRPAVEVLFNSVAQDSARYAVAGILTGMGKDGAEAMKYLKDSGAWTIGQDEASCVVYGMPGVAHRLGALCTQSPLRTFSKAICDGAARMAARFPEVSLA